MAKTFRERLDELKYPAGVLSIDPYTYQYTVGGKPVDLQEVFSDFPTPTDECFKLDIGPIQEAALESFPAPRCVGCGAEIMGKRKARGYKECGDCCLEFPHERVSLDQRIAEAQPPKVDKDPTEAWGAGQTPVYEWP